MARKKRIGDASLVEAVQRAENGLIDADLGACLIKQRVAREGGGRLGGYRTILFLKEGKRAVFLHLFEKSRTANLTPAEQDAYRAIAKILASLGNLEFAQLVQNRQWKEIAYEPEENIPK